MAHSQNTLPTTVLIVDDGSGGLDRLIPLLADAGLRVVQAASTQAASGLLAQTQPDVLIVEQAVLTPHSSDLQELRGRDHRVAVIMQCGPVGTQQRRELMRQFDLDGIHERGADPKGLLRLIEAARARIGRGGRADRGEELRALVVVKLCHDLRSSLHVIRGYAEILAEGDDAPAHEIATRLLAVSDAALALTQDCLDLTGLDAVAAPSEAHPAATVDLDALLGEVHAAATRQIGDRPLRFTIAVPFACACIRVDVETLRAVLLHVLADAVRASRRGEIRLLVRAEDAGTAFILEDPRALEDAEDVSRKLSATESGAGESDVGLATALRSSRILGGTLTVKAGAAGGARFVLRLPARLSRKPKAPAPRVLH